MLAYRFTHFLERNFDLNLVKLYLSATPAPHPTKCYHTSHQPSRFPRDGWHGTRVLVGATTTSTTERLSMAGLGLKQAKLLSTNYGANEWVSLRLACVCYHMQDGNHMWCSKVNFTTTDGSWIRASSPECRWLSCECTCCSRHGVGYKGTGISILYTGGEGGVPERLTKIWKAKVFSLRDSWTARNGF